MADAAIRVEGLVRSFGKTRAVDGVAFTVARGEIFGFLGHNGAGKTTTVRLLNGVLARDAGAVRVLGLDPSTDGDALRARTGVLTESPSLDERFTARENLAYSAALYDVPRAAARARIDALLRDFDLAAVADPRAGTFSKGMKQKLAIARALLHGPELVYLDEPTSGLDPAASRQLHDRMRALKRDGVALFFTTHRLAEAAELCDRVAIVDRGRVVALGTPDELSRGAATSAPLELDLHPDDRARAETELAGHTLTRRGELLLVDGVAREEVPAIVARLAAAGVRLYGARLPAASLEDAYLALTRRAAAHEEAA